MNRYLVILALLFLSLIAHAQVSIGSGDTVNEYYSVSDVSSDKVGTDTITCTTDVSTLAPGDKVLLIQMTGAIFDNQGYVNQDGNFSGNGYGGNYELLSVLDVNNSTKEVVFTSPLENDYNDSEKIQLVKIFEEIDVTVETELTVPDWDSLNGIGGVLAMVVLRKLTLKNNIDVGGRGFNGASKESYETNCRVFNASDTMYFSQNTSYKGGRKGEGLKSVSSNLTIGPGNNFNGGGGGFGKYGGGAGGSNATYGGKGGIQYAGCDPTSASQVAQPGVALEALAAFYGDESIKKITFGGGGGGSTYSGGLSSRPGGNGGGIVIILADTIVGNGNAIIANGDPVLFTSQAGAGGGGGGGLIALDVAYYDGPLDLTLTGGDGGDIATGTGIGACGGPGGGGSGGVILNSSNALSGNITVNYAGGDDGAGGDCANSATSGSSGVTFNNYSLLLNGFTFNYISGDDIICNGQQPDTIKGTIPKGAIPGDISYKWYSSPDNTNWSLIVGADQIHYQPEVLYAAGVTDTVYYRREVIFTSGISDFSIPAKIVVYPNIANNVLTLRDTICLNDSPGVLSAETLTGGEGNYTYKWWYSTDQATWYEHPLGDLNTEFLDETTSLTETRFYRREAWSGEGDVCYSESNIDTVSVLDLITNNVFENQIPSDTLICEGLSGGILLGALPTGGDNENYSYSWLISTDDNTYSPISSALDQTYDAGNRSNTTYFKRVVYSGLYGACVDTSSYRRVNVLTTIANNIIVSDSSKYCEGDTPDKALVQGATALAGGDYPNYVYQWQIDEGGVWKDVSGATSANYLPTEALTNTTSYRRLVFSGDDYGALYACIDSSATAEFTISVIPSISNSLISGDTNICEATLPLLLEGDPASGGSGLFNYIWQYNPNNAGWSTAIGTSDEVNYTTESLTESTLFRRLVESDICTSISDEIDVVVHDTIDNNFIEGAAKQYTCSASEKNLNGTSPTGGFNGYNYLWQNSANGVTAWADASNGGNIDFVSQSLTTTTFYRRVVLSGDDGVFQCKDTSNVVQVLINALPTGDITSATGVDTLCEGDNITIDYTGLTESTSWTIVVGEDSELYSENVSTSSGSLTFPLNESANIKVLSIQNDSSCFADISSNTGLVAATVYKMPVANPGDVTEVCGLSTQLNAELSTPGTGLWASDDGVFSNEMLPNSTYSVENFGEVQLSWTETNWKCVDPAFIDVTFFEQPTEVNAGEDLTLNYVLDTTLVANIPDYPATGFWSFTQGEGEFDDSTLANASIKFPVVGEYSLSWTIVNGNCKPISDDLNVLIHDLELSNGFSPNGDGINDFYKLRFPSGLAVKMTLFDRYGNVVREINGTYNIKWDGTNESGQQVPEDTYYYVIEEGGHSARNGFIDIRR